MTALLVATASSALEPSAANITKTSNVKVAINGICFFENIRYVPSLVYVDDEGDAVVNVRPVPRPVPAHRGLAGKIYVAPGGLAWMY